MRLRLAAIWIGMTVLAALAAHASAAAVPLTVNATSIQSIQTFTLGENATDSVYLLVSGIAGGKDVQARVPKDKVLPSAPKQPAITSKQPLELWKGELNDGEFALLTITLMQGKGEDSAPVKQYLDALAAADQKVPEWSKKTLTDADLKQLEANSLKANRGVVMKIKDIFSRDKKTDHFGGQFTVIFWNNGGKIVKRLDPVGLTFGEHNGNDIKIYSKLKDTRNNVLVQDDKGQWSEEQLEPLNDEQTAVRVKMLETEYVKRGAENPLRHVTDYLVEITAVGPGDKPLKWDLGGEVTGIDIIHTYWNFAQ